MFNTSCAMYLTDRAGEPYPRLFYPGGGRATAWISSGAIRVVAPSSMAGAGVRRPRDLDDPLQMAGRGERGNHRHGTASPWSSDVI